MSLILEALRKSEAERRRGLAPDVAMELPPTQTTRPRTPPAWLLPALTVAALLVLGGWWGRRESAKAPSPETASEIPRKITPATNDSSSALMPRILPTPAAPAMAEVPAPAPTAAPPPIPVPASMAKPSPSLAASQPAPIPPKSIQPSPSRSPSLPASDISTDTSMLPSIKLSMHMWDEVPSRRFVILNGQRMAEGDHYGAITVIAIQRNGVLVESDGSRSLVPLP